MKEKLHTLLSKEIVAGLAHNINTPLNLILGYAQQMQSRGFNPDHLQKILDAGFRIDEILSATMQGIMFSQDVEIRSLDLVELLRKEIVLLTDDLRVKRVVKFIPEGLTGSHQVKSIPAAICLLFGSLVHQIKDNGAVDLSLELERAEGKSLLKLGLVYAEELCFTELYLPSNHEICEYLGLSRSHELFGLSQHGQQLVIEIYDL